MAHGREVALAEPAGRYGEGHAHIARLHEGWRVSGHGLHHALRAARQQLLRVRVLRVREDLGRCAHLDELAAFHHADTMREAAHQVEVVRDEEQRHAHLGLQLIEQRQDLRLDGDVQRRGRLVADQEFGLARQRHGDHGALALPARELMRIDVNAPCGLGDAGARQQLDGTGACRIRPQSFVQLKHLADLIAHRVQRVERRHRLLKNHGDAAAAQAAHLALALAQEVFAGKADGAAGDCAVDQAQHRQSSDRFARTRLTDQGEFLARRDVEGHVVNHRRSAEAHAEMVDVEQGLHVRTFVCRRRRATHRQ